MNPYLSIVRVDHWFKNVLVVPGILVAWLLSPSHQPPSLATLTIGGVAIILIVSANYSINEFLDRASDRFHPTKRHRAGVRGELRGPLVALQYLTLGAAGCALATLVNGSFAATAAVLLLMGVLYNLPPIRTKDRVYLDVLSESVNNPLRFLLGWFMVLPSGFPPASILISYWMGGAFLMGVKRYAEYRQIGDRQAAAAYRRSFRAYSEDKLLLSSVFYAINSAFFLGVFLIKYRIEFLLSLPLFAVLFVWYLKIGLEPDSAAVTPERLYVNREFLLFMVLLSAVVVALFFIDIPSLHILQEPRF